MKQFFKVIIVGLFLGGSIGGHNDLQKEEDPQKVFVEKMKALEEDIKLEIQNPTNAAQLYIKFAQEHKFPLNKQYEFHRMRGELLLLAAAFGHAEVVELLLRDGVDVETSTYFGQTALFCAVEYGHLLVAKLLLDYGADMYKQNRYNETPLGLASRQSAQWGNLFQMYASNSKK